MRPLRSCVASVSARAGRLSHDPTEDPVAFNATAGAGTGAGLAGAASECGPAPPVHAGDGPGAWGGRSGPGGDELQPVAGGITWFLLPKNLHPVRGHAFSSRPAQRFLGPGRPRWI